MDWRRATTGRLRWALVLALALAIAVAGVALSDRIAGQRAVDSEHDRLTAVARLAASGYQRQVDKFQLVATTLTADPNVIDLLDRRSDTAALRLNQRLAGLSTALDASVIYLIDAGGTTIASSNSRQPDSFLGQNYGFRAYFVEAMARGRWEQYALGTRSRIPGLFVARRVITPDGKRGVIVVKIRFDRLEREWATTLGDAFVASAQGVILITSRPSWRFETVAMLDDAARQRMTAQVEYGDAPLRQNALFASRAIIRSGAELGSKARYIAATEQLPDGWTVQVLAPIADTVRNARSSGRLVIALGLAIIAALATAFLLRARAIVARERAETETRIAELKDRLVQANRMSTLGQVAAGVGHEINQPLTAIGIRAQAARKLVAAGRIDAAGVVFDEIGALVARAGAITGELRRFARRGRTRLSPVTLSDVFDGTRLLLGERLRSTNTRLIIEGPDPVVMGDQGRLEQVFVNLIQNALDAMGKDGRIRIAVSCSSDTVTVRVADNGPGIPEAISARLFQPFTSSKDDGLGLGLVISQDIVADMGGTLTFASGEPGATFVVTLRTGR